MSSDVFAGGLPDEMTLGEARAWLRVRAADKGARCPCCTQFTMIYPRRRIYAPMARALIAMHRAVASSSSGWFHMPTVIAANQVGGGGDAAKLRWWNLIVEDDGSRRPDGGRAGWWKVTPLGHAFARDEVRLPTFAEVYDNRLLRLHGPLHGIRDALGRGFDYDDLMGR